MSEISRRRFLHGAAAAAACAGAAAVVGGAPAGAAEHPGDPGAGEAFDEVYRGRRIQGAPVTGGGHHHGGGGGLAVLVDGRPLHVMRNADGSWISVVHHYRTFATPRALTRAAVDELQGAALVPLG